MMDTDPFVICQFHCQQLKCVRDKFGNVVEGGADTIQRVYYFWGLQQVSEAERLKVWCQRNLLGLYH